MNDSLFGADFVHPTQAGYEAMAARVAASLRLVPAYYYANLMGAA